LIIARALKSILLVGMLRSSVPVLPAAETLAFVVRIILAGCISGAAAYATLKLIPGKAWIHQVVKCGAVGAVALGAFVAMSLLLRLPEPRLCLQWSREKLNRRRKK